MVRGSNAFEKCFGFGVGSVNHFFNVHLLGVGVVLAAILYVLLLHGEEKFFLADELLEGLLVLGVLGVLLLLVSEVAVDRHRALRDVEALLLAVQEFSFVLMGRGFRSLEGGGPGLLLLDLLLEHFSSHILGCHL